MTESHDHILIIGTGFAGLGMGIRLKQAGIHDFTILEKDGGVGGTWRANHYPGAACDVESHLYSFSFEPNPRWSRSFATQPEILAYLEHCADKYGLRPHIRFNTAVTSAAFDERAGVWNVKTSDGKSLRARVLVSGSGGLSRPAYPDIPGLASFQGKTFHSARWDDSAALDGKRVAVIGTGASAIQIVPAIAPRVEQLCVYQRTPPWIVPKRDYPISERQRAIFRRAPFLQQLVRDGIYLQRELFGIGFVLEPRLLKLAEGLVRKYLNQSVSDRALRDKLRPDYALGCKRVLPTNDYYPALQRPNVELVTEGIESVLPHGIRTRDGKERELDALVLATGFQAAEAVAPFEVRGRGGLDLGTVWSDGAEAYLGTTVAGFPNLFLIVGPNTGLGHSSMVLMIESQIQYVLSAVQTMRARGIEQVDVRADVQARYNARIHERLEHTVWNSGCKSWYRTRSGKNTTLWPGFTFEYRFKTRRFDVESYELTAAGAGKSVGAASGAFATGAPS
jgi:cation diffusion facilitator CzcD-associated flavoprotein CzcO